MEVIHHGGHRTVTGSCHEFRYAPGRAILVDCGLLQEGNHADQAQQIDFQLDAIDALVITHSHLDHVGRIPWLLAAGFRKPIYCTTATAELLPLILSDAIKVGITRDRKVIEGLLDLLQQLIRPLKYDQWLSISDDLMIRFRQAGHILGSAYVECEINTQRVVFSGDIGCKNTPLLADPTPLERADWLFLESTYGNRLHEPRRDRTARLSQVIQRCIENKGAILIPAFAIGRTQELLYDIEQIIDEMQRLPHDKYEFPVVVLDSPLAAAVTERYARLKALWDDEAKDRIAKGRHPLDFSQLVTITSHADHERLVNRL
ncbi:MAG TPA: MBL fold metallo-hydrolase, partial [Pseudidiomarina sp.]|nr:MBL fold metallo-hydrolase [Pseudidiomarina sp.]